MILDNLPSWQIITFFVFLFLFIIVGGIIAFVLVRRSMWPLKYRIIENVAGLGYIPTRQGRCRLVGFGDGGEEIFFLKGINKYRPGYGKRIGKNQVAWAIGQDGYWYNVTFGNLDKRLMELGLNPVDRDMRLANASIRKGVEFRYNQKSFYEKYGTAITIGMLVIAIIAQGVSGYYLMKKVNEGVQISAEVAKVNLETAKLSNQILTNIDNIKGGGSGLKPA